MRYSIRDNPGDGTNISHQFTDDEGNPIPSDSRKVPEILTDKDLEEMARKKLRELKH